jgi:hypothetical protein
VLPWFGGLQSPVGFGGGGGTPPPTFISQNTDFASAAGNVPGNLILTGTFPPSTTVTVGGYVATIVSNTGTVLTVTTPVDTANPVDGEASASVVRMATSGGHVDTSIWLLPSSWSAQGAAGGGGWTAADVTVSGGTITSWIDQSGNGNNLAPSQVGPAQAGYNATGGGSGGGLPYGLFSSATVPYYNNNVNNIPGAPAPELIIACRMVHNAAFPTYGGLFQLSDNTFPGPTQYGIETNVNLFDGGPTVAIVAGQDMWIDAYFSATAGALSVNGAAATTGGSPILGSGGITMGGWYPYAGSYGWNGFIYQSFFCPTQLSAQGRLNFGAYFAAKGIG